MIAWREAYNIGVDRIDHQHQELIRTLNDFMDACIQQKGKDKVMETLAFLKKYSREHFQNEEALMLEYSYPEYADHKDEHDDFIRIILEFENDVLLKGPNFLSTVHLNRILMDWLTRHICHSDAKIAAFLSENKLETCN